MFNLNRSQSDDKFNKKNIKSDFLNFSSNETKDKFLNELASDNKFIQDEMELRAMVVYMLEQEFGKNITNIKGYDVLVDSVIDNIKKKQNNSQSVFIDN